MLERLFKLREHNVTVGIEIAAGATTFLTMAYILVVNPLILSNTGMPREALYTATAIAIIIATLLMAFWANMPFALAPGMGINAFFTYVVVMAKGYTWQEALTAVFVAGILFLILSVTGVREALVNDFPEALKYAVGVSLGLMIATIGMKNCGLIVASGTENRFVLGDIRSGAPLLALIGLAITAIILALKVKGGLLLGIAITTVIGYFMGQTNLSPLTEGGILKLPPSVSPIFLSFSVDFSRIVTLDFAVVIFTFLFVDIFDSLGTFLGVLNRVGIESGHYKERIPKALTCDAVGTIAGAIVGTSTVTTYVESSAGVTAGGRTGLTALTVGLLFLISMFFSPLFLVVPAAATAPAMIVVGLFLMEVATRINFTDIAEGLPAILAILVTALTVSISDGLMFGWVSLVVIKLCSGRLKELNVVTLVFAAIFVLKMAFL
ncbi:MAG: NCS2 family permease [Planctomycetota bacterium]|jgi:AGZA family xanthine/uracil permease-like MFS transporter|nr:NCS2 family permease [Planctomycetota bacterium]